MPTWVGHVDHAGWLGELHHGLFEVRERSLHQQPPVPEVVEQVVPEGLFGEQLGIADDNQSVLAPLIQ